MHRGLKSGTVLTRIEDNPDTGYSLVRMDDGLEGWIQTQYISEEPVAAIQLATITRERDELQRRFEELQGRLQQTVAVRDQLSEDNDQLAQEGAGLKRELQRITELASDTISVDQQNQSLVSEQEDLNQQIDRLMIETAALESSENQEWFLMGGGIVLLGLLFGFLFGRKIYHRRESGW
ncbi:MAG: TIGR04211 family SH3 domain-containing protein [Pseudomonadota bacterium]